MDENPDVAIFRRFGDLNLLNLLYLQSELSWLIEDYRDILEEDVDSENSETKQFSAQWIKLVRSETCPQQWDKWLEIRCKLEQYSETANALSVATTT